MPLSELQKTLLKLLAENRDEKSFLGGGAPINLAAARTSADLDIFHDRSGRLLETADADAAILAAHGYAIEWLHRREALCSAKVSRGEEETRLDWVVDSDFRFFPPMRSQTFGYVLHPFDIATNKVLAAASRREPRDAVDLVTIAERFYPLGAVIWAALAKDPGWSPESLIAEIRRTARYNDEELRSLDLEEPIGAAELSRKLRAALMDAEGFVLQMPSSLAGLAFMEGDRIVQPDPKHLERYATHACVRGGHWPSSPDAASAMLKAWEHPR